MILTSIRTNQLTESGSAWYFEYLQALDRRDLESILRFISEDASLQINNQLPLHGKPAITAALQRYWAGFKSIEHEPLAILGDDRLIAVEMLCHYKRLSGDIFTLPASSFKDRDSDGLITSVRIFADMTPIFA